MKWLLLVLPLLLLLGIALSDPPTPHNVFGFVRYENGSGVENGWPVRVNDTNQSTIANTEVFAPPVPSLMGAYSAVISGEDGDTVLVYSWNDTHYGQSSGVLLSSTQVNVTINLTRNPEPNITIIQPPNNSLYNISVPFNVTVNVSILGGGGSCSVTISFGNTSVLNISSGESFTHDLGSVSIGDVTNTNFTVEGIGVGTSSITAASNCSPSGPIFEATNWDVLENVTISGVAPIITLISPPDNTLNETSNLINFTYSVSSATDIANCSLIFDGVVQATDTNVTAGVEDNFTFVVGNGQYNWSVNCTDVDDEEGSSTEYNLTVQVLRPNVTVFCDSPVVLNAGSEQTATCNVSVRDESGQADIISVNATFYAAPNISSSPDDNNGHYTNASCSEISAFDVWKNFTCSFSLVHYAVNGTWSLNATALDGLNLTGNFVNTTTIDPLYALNVSDTFLNFGDLAGKQFSATLEQNVSNIGNQPINVTVYGYGGTPGDNNAFSCGIDNISVGFLKFAPNVTATYQEKEELSGSLKQLRMTIDKQVDTSQSRNSSYWQLFVPNNISDRGLCNGTIVFHAALS